MKSKLIRILIALCFVGIAVFGVIVFLGNHDVEKKAYAEIIAMRNDTEFETLYSKAAVVDKDYNGANCDYAIYTNNAVKELNAGIDYYLNYLQNMNGMNKNDKDSLVNQYTAYINGIKNAKTAYQKYFNFANALNPTPNDKAQVSVQSANFVKEYLKAFGEGYKFFINLQNIVDTKVFSGKMFKSFTQISYEMGTTFVNQSINDVTNELEKKINEKAYRTTPYLASAYANNFNILFNANASKTKITPGNEMKNSTYANFIVNYNKLGDIEAFLVDCDTYIANNSSDQAAPVVKAFLTNASHYGFKMGGTV